MLESKIEKTIVTYAELKNILCYKFLSPSNRGVPDRLFITPNGFAFFIEFKAKNKKLSPLQDIKIKNLRANKTLVFVVDNIELGKSIIDNIIKDNG